MYVPLSTKRGSRSRSEASTLRAGRRTDGARRTTWSAGNDHAVEAAFAHSQTAPPRQPIEPLAAREEEVLVPVAQGRTNSEIAGELYITQSTVKAHLASLMRKLGARNRVEVAMWVYETGRV